MIETLTIAQDWRCFRTGDRFVFSLRVTALVGDQGTGKTSMIALLVARTGGKRIPAGAKAHEVAALTLSPPTGPTEYRWFDSEKHNPRVKTHIETELDIFCRFVSHGQLQLPALLGLLKKCGALAVAGDKQQVVLLDEPEAGLSQRSQEKVAAAVRAAADAGVQIIVATHSAVITAAADATIDLDARELPEPPDFQ